jgi:hypothetical protein
MTDHDPALSRALDLFDAPPPRASLVDDIVAQAMKAEPPKTEPWSRPARDRRSGWARRAMLGVAAFSLSAAAAASGWLGEPLRRLPVISSIAAVIPKAVQARPVTKPAPTLAVTPKPKPTAPVPVQKPPAIEASTAPVTVTPARDVKVPQDTTDVKKPAQVERPERVERIVGRIEHRLDARDARRTARGLAPDSAAERAALEKFQAAQTPDERQAARRDMRALRDNRKADFRKRIDERTARTDAGLPPLRRPLCTPEQADRPFRNGCRLEHGERNLWQGRQLRGRRSCADFPPGGWLPPRCRRAAPASIPEQRGEPIPE